ncbi:MAG: stage V sporulation protein AB [Bacillota bacterium]
MMFRWISLAVVGLAQGAVVGTALVAFVTILDIVPRLAQATNTRPLLNLYQWSLVIGATVGATIPLQTMTLHGPVVLAAGVGLVAGTFFGLITSAVAEVLNVLPILGRRLRMTSYISLFVWALLLGKALGSLVYWLVPGFGR